MSNFQKIYDEEFWMICNLPKTAGIVLTGLLRYASNKDTEVKKGYRIKTCYPSQALLSSFTGNSERQIREGVKQLKEHLILDTYLEGRRNIYRLCYPIGMEKIQELVEEIQEENSLYIQKIQEEKCNIIGGKVYTIQEEKCIQHRRKSVSKNVIDLKDHIVTENKKQESSSLLKEKRKEKLKENIKEKQNNNNKPKFFYIPEQGGFSDWRK
jgi:DNA-binding transcriptional ArsR family regulator